MVASFTEQSKVTGSWSFINAERNSNHRECLSKSNIRANVNTLKFVYPRNGLTLL